MTIKANKAILLRFAHLFGLVCLSYGVMYLDKVFTIWSIVGLNYSTHTAISFVLTWHLSHYVYTLRLLWISLFLSYMALMLYQKYHSIPDILTTSIVLFLILVGCQLTVKFVLVDKAKTKWKTTNRNQ